MAKLNKQEVNAVASKLHRKLEEIAKQKREEALKNYTPSKTYTTVENLLKQRDVIEERIELLKQEKKQIVQDLENICREKCNIYWLSEKETDIVLNSLISTEYKLAAVPTVEELKDDVTIAAIDEEFDTASFIEQQLEKFN